MQFTNLKLTGFKSFVDPTEMHIEPGLTGVVGPNGCGKSNLVEALKWVMGESSAKQLRGGEMDDVIFGGSAERPLRSIAEVVIRLDNKTRNAPAAFNDSDSLEVSRRIERGAGSNYRINGREVRARDVQLLFADAASGARSTALVSQGQIGAMINAKAAQRRGILEEAAGITGLHSRRHEAELRLRGAEANLERLGDVMIALEEQLRNLKKQARQATRYRNLSGHIRNAEATLLYLRWTVALDELDHARDYLKNLEAAATEMAAMAASAATHQLQAAEGLPELRQDEARLGAELQRYTLERSALDGEEERLEKTTADLRNRATQAEGDRTREQVLVGDAEAALARLESDRSALEESCLGEADDQAAALRRAEALDAEVQGLEERLQVLTEEAAGRSARRAELERRQAEAVRRQSREEAHRAALKERLHELEATAVDADALTRAGAEAAAGDAAVEAAGAALDSAEEARTAAEANASKSNEVCQEAGAAVTRAEAEERTLAQLLDSGHGADARPLLDMLSVEPGFETALVAALGEDLDAPVNGESPVRWQIDAFRPASAALPEGVQALDKVVKGPLFLERRLSQVGVVADEQTGQRLAAALLQGQRLVSRDGALWRWDGYTVAVGAPTPAAARLEHRNRLAEVREELEQAQERLEQARDAARKGQAACETARQEQQRAQADLAAKEQQARDARDVADRLRRDSAAMAEQRAAMEESGTRIEEELAHIEGEIQEVAQALTETPAPTRGPDELSRLREQTVAKRKAQTTARQAYDTLCREAEERRRSLQRLDEEAASWTERRTGALGRVAELEARKMECESALDALIARPDEIAAKRARLSELVDKTETRRRASADRLAEAENKLRDADRALKEVESELQKAREARVRAEFRVEQGDQTCRSLAERIADRLGCAPDDLWDQTGLKDPDDLPDMPSVETRLERLLRERDLMGAVNLRAEEEVKGLTEQTETLMRERQDLEKAIDKLRRGIAELNREARQRLLASFETVNRNFGDLFVRLFGGGKAHLSLEDADDPLNAGLEIMAQPPGKKLQSLSLLSGGEQALTATALLFAVFLTNPAPICVLDEVDAPLDDANVDRFCTLVEDISRSNETRFLVVTHHRMTMARMDRLYGITMQERGVSKLVSVNLQRAEELRESA